MDGSEGERERERALSSVRRRHPSSREESGKVSQALNLHTASSFSFSEAGAVDSKMKDEGEGWRAGAGARRRRSSVTYIRYFTCVEAANSSVAMRRISIKPGTKYVMQKLFSTMFVRHLPFHSSASGNKVSIGRAR